MMNISKVSEASTPTKEEEEVDLRSKVLMKDRSNSMGMLRMSGN